MDLPTLTLALQGTLDYVIVAVAAVIGLAMGGGGAVVFARGFVASARGRAKQIVANAEAEAETVGKQAALEARKTVLEERDAFEKERSERRAELDREERSVSKREARADRELARIEDVEKSLNQAKAATDAERARLEQRDTELQALETQRKSDLARVAKMTQDEARSALLEAVEDDVREESAELIRTRIEDAEDQAKEKSVEIMLQSMQRCASELVAESAVRTVEIPSDDVKGRIIGREGRNIRAFEKELGVDLIVDDTPGVIVVSCFDKVRQAIAVESLNRLIADGRIHPTRIEEVVVKVREEMNEKISTLGKEAQREAKLKKLHPKMVDALGRLHFRTSYGQNVLRHSIEVGFIAQMIADQLGLNGALARRCGVLHDIGKALDHELEGGHPAIGMDFAKQYGERDPVLNAIGGHHGDIPSTSYYTPIVMAADALSGARPGARRDSLEAYIRRLEQLQDIAKGHEGVDEAFAIQAGREVRVMVDAAAVSDDRAYVIAKDIAKQVSDEMTFPGEIRVTVLRETRAIEIAR